MKKSFWASRPFGYGEYPMLDVGQVIEIEPGQQPNDEKLIRLGLFKPLEGKPVQCGKCGAMFCDSTFLNRHGNLQHAKSALERGREVSPDADIEVAKEIGNLRALEAADQFASSAVPLHLENSKATREGRRASR